ncbi:MAG: hypothetical protein JWL84_4841 [Rhodospirillales bacterium]|nr:hypothetical protein [Rhodospirillales bacterium]
MKRGQRRHACGRQIAVEIDPVQMDEVDGPSRQSLGDPAAACGLRRLARRLVEQCRRRRDRKERPGDDEAGASDHDRVMTRLRQRLVQ